MIGEGLLGAIEIVCRFEKGCGALEKIFWIRCICCGLNERQKVGPQTPCHQIHGKLSGEILGWEKFGRESKIGLEVIILVLQKVEIFFIL